MQAVCCHYVILLFDLSDVVKCSLLAMQPWTLVSGPRDHSLFMARGGLVRMQGGHPKF